MKRISILFLLFALVAVSQCVEAQENGFVVGVAGLTFAESTSGLFGAEVGVNITPRVHVIGTVERMQDVLTGNLAESLKTVSRATGVRIDGTLPATYAAGGIRYSFSAGGTVRPYIQIEGGVGKTDPRLTFRADGQDITSEVEEAAQLSETNGALAFSFGARIDFSERMTSEIAFKWLNIFSDETLKINRLHFGIGARF